MNRRGNRLGLVTLRYIPTDTMRVWAGGKKVFSSAAEGRLGLSAALWGQSTALG